MSKHAKKNAASANRRLAASMTTTAWFHVVGIISASLLGLGFITGLISVGLSWKANRELQTELRQMDAKNLETGRTLEAERSRRLELEKYFQPREIPSREWARIVGQPDPVKPLIPFSGITAIISVLPELEPNRAAANIVGTLEAAAWTVKGEGPPSGIATPAWDGVKLDKATGGRREGDKAPEATTALMEVLRSYNWEVSNHNVSPEKLPINTVRITIGFNSVSRYFWPRRMTELIEDEERRTRVRTENANEKRSPK
jgi:hypothetical protein